METKLAHLPPLSRSVLNIMMKISPMSTVVDLLLMIQELMKKCTICGVSNQQNPQVMLISNLTKVQKFAQWSVVK